jgi:hypothetical protein
MSEWFPVGEPLGTTPSGHAPQVVPTRGLSPRRGEALGTTGLRCGSRPAEPSSIEIRRGER